MTTRTPTDASHLPDRRRFLKRAAAGAALAATPAWTRAPSKLGLTIEELSDRRDFPGTEDEAFWEMVKSQFPLRPGLILMNAANLCPSPYPVQEAVFGYTRDIDQDASFHNRAKFSALAAKSVDALAELLGASPEEVVITRNTSESNNAVINGLTMGAGDEVVLWDQNHPTNNVAWDVRADRWGYKVIRVTTPPAPESEDELVDAFVNAFTDRTRVLSVTQISNISGVELPASRLCSIARDRGIYVHMDGAQSFGAVEVDLHAMGCDSYTGSAHKWFCGPKEAGVLYVRADRVAELWPSVVGVGWDGASAGGGADKFGTFGQRDDAAVAGVGTTVEFHQAVGPAAIEARTRALAAALKAAIRERVPDVSFHTSDVPGLSAGVVIAELPVDDHTEIYNRIYEEHGVAGALRTAAFPGIRLCPHMYNTMAEVEQVADALARSV
ncbi:aminotransferase class V-fold PLP-dependent enzyme [Candidatus Palauibacter sp.]|uniref:aminotransferase class V-fold PLP-dependent enzyme n=1 Tax=Candidatus Palauibacter sp. TaxID=3101350 RepID=UPI003AF2A5CB